MHVRHVNAGHPRPGLGKLIFEVIAKVGKSGASDDVGLMAFSLRPGLLNINQSHKIKWQLRHHAQTVLFTSIVTCISFAASARLSS